MKKMLAMILAMSMCAATIAGCGGSKDKEPASVDEVKGEVFDAGSVSALVPEGWVAYPVADMWAEEADTMDPTRIQICKDAESEMDMFTKPYVDITYYDEDSIMMEPSSDWYEDVEDLEPMTLGGKTWNGFKATGLVGDYKFALLWTGEADGDQYQVTVWLDASEGSVNIDDADVQAILDSIQPSA